MSTYTPISSITLASAASSVTFSGIPQTYTDLVLVVSTKNSGTPGAQVTNLRFNGDTGSNYSRTSLDGNGTSASSLRTSNQTVMDLLVTADGVQGNMIVQILNYTNTTTNKTVLGRSNITNWGVRQSVGLWRNTAAINQINVTVDGGSGSNFDSNSTFNLYGIANASITNVAKATGGDSVYTDGTYWYHIFRSSGTFTPTQALTADYLVVAGGGGGGTPRLGGGGGAGGLRCTVGATGGGGSLESALSLTAQAYTVTVGAGGAAGTNGNNSVFSTITSTAGGAGRNTIGNNGGSGGGGGDGNNAGGTGTANQGNNGGSGTGGSGEASYAGGGGGGANAAGVNATVSSQASGGNGGSGVTTSISSASTVYAGGGGGGNSSQSSGSAGTGGSGGGGNGGKGANGVAGTANTGSGGGGAGIASGTDFVGGAGGSGIVIIRYGI